MELIDYEVLMDRFKIGDDGKTAEQRRTGKKWEKVAIPFGERIQVKELVKDSRKRDLEPRWVTGYYVGHASRSGTPSNKSFGDFCVPEEKWLSIWVGFPP